MPKKKGLGRDVNNSLEIMSELLNVLSKFTNMPLKKGLKSNGIDDKEIHARINKALESASALANQVWDLKEDVKSLRDPSVRSSRFASSKRVLTNFISDQA